MKNIWGGGDVALPNVSYCKDNNEVHYNPVAPSVEPLIATYSVMDAGLTQLYFYSNGGEFSSLGVNMFDKVKIDGTEMSVSNLDSSEGKHYFSIGEHTVEYILKDPTKIGLVEESGSIVQHGSFLDCTEITNIIIPNSVITVGHDAFNGCSHLTSLIIPNNVTSVGDSIVSNCFALTSVTIGSSVASMTRNVFANSNSLTSITSLATTAPTIMSYTFRGINSNGILYVPSGSSGYDTWMNYLGSYNWTKVEQ